MKASFYQRQIAELIEKVKLGAGDEAEATSVLNANEMRDDERRQAEIKMFESLPQIVAP